VSLASETTAICGAINAQFSTTSPAVAPDKAAALTTDHVIVFVSRRYVPDQLLSGEVTAPGGRVVTRYVSKSVANLSNTRDKTRAALEDKFAGSLGPFEFETEDPITDEADGWYVAADSWVY
jgi:hypothetical protein